MARQLTVVLAALSLAGTAAAADLEAGRVRAAQACAVCHGQLGVSTAPDAPNLAGQPALYVASQLRAYRNGSRKHEVISTSNVVQQPGLSHCNKLMQIVDSTSCNKWCVAT